MKKIISILLAALFTLASLVACGSDEQETSDTSNNKSNSSVASDNSMNSNGSQNSDESPIIDDSSIPDNNEESSVPDISVDVSVPDNSETSDDPETSDPVIVPPVGDPVILSGTYTDLLTGDATITFSEDGSFVRNISGQIKNGTYKCYGEQLELTIVEKTTKVVYNAESDSFYYLSLTFTKEVPKQEIGTYVHEGKYISATDSDFAITFEGNAVKMGQTGSEQIGTYSSDGKTAVLNFGVSEMTLVYDSFNDVFLWEGIMFEKEGDGSGISVLNGAYDAEGGTVRVTFNENEIIMTIAGETKTGSYLLKRGKIAITFADGVVMNGEYDMMTDTLNLNGAVFERALIGPLDGAYHDEAVIMAFVFTGNNVTRTSGVEGTVAVGSYVLNGDQLILTFNDVNTVAVYDVLTDSFVVEGILFNKAKS